MGTYKENAIHLLNECQELQPHDHDLYLLNRLFAEYAILRNTLKEDNIITDNVILNDLKFIQKCISNAQKSDKELSADFLPDRFSQFSSARQGIIEDLIKIIQY